MSNFEKTLEIIRAMDETCIDPGLTAEEFAAAEARFGICFPPDLKGLLAAGLPIGPRWPNWRAATQHLDGDAAQELDARLDWPRVGMCFDVEHNVFWDPEWGARPASLVDALRVAERAVRAAPRLIPVYAHRYLPEEPCSAGNPVLSVHQMDIIVYRRDLHHYVLTEAGGWTAELAGGERAIRSWTRWMLAEWECDHRQGPSADPR